MTAGLCLLVEVESVSCHLDMGHDWRVCLPCYTSRWHFDGLAFALSHNYDKEGRKKKVFSSLRALLQTILKVFHPSLVCFHTALLRVDQYDNICHEIIYFE